MAEYKVALNADMAESFGLYTIGNDAKLMEYLTTANLACGFHAGDPMVMQQTVRLAKKHGVSAGAHPGFKDMQGFGRRMLDVSPEEMYADTLYQMGALDAFLRVEGMKMTHVCPHGMLDPLVSDNEPFAKMFIQAVKDYDPALRLVVEEKSLIAKLCAEEGVGICMVGYPDLSYDAQGNMVIDRKKSLKDPAEVAAQSLRMVTEGKARAVDGSTFPVKVGMLSYHGDVPNAVEVLQEVVKTLKAAGVELVGL